MSEKSFNPLDHVSPELREFTESFLKENSEKLASMVAQSKLQEMLNEIGVKGKITSVSLENFEVQLEIEIDGYTLKGVFTKVD